MACAKKIFATQESWSMYRDEKDFWITMAPPQHNETILDRPL